MTAPDYPRARFVHSPDHRLVRLYVENSPGVYLVYEGDETVRSELVPEGTEAPPFVTMLSDTYTALREAIVDPFELDVTKARLEDARKELEALQLRYDQLVLRESTRVDRLLFGKDDQ